VTAIVYPIKSDSVYTQTPLYQTWTVVQNLFTPS